jgi:hypothetical protein
MCSATTACDALDGELAAQAGPQLAQGPAQGAQWVGRIGEEQGGEAAASQGAIGE